MSDRGLAIDLRQTDSAPERLAPVAPASSAVSSAARSSAQPNPERSPAAAREAKRRHGQPRERSREDSGLGDESDSEATDGAGENAPPGPAHQLDRLA